MCAPLGLIELAIEGGLEVGIDGPPSEWHSEIDCFRDVDIAIKEENKDLV